MSVKTTLRLTNMDALGQVSECLRTLAHANRKSAETTALFVVGGVTGMLLGNLAGRRLSGPALQKVFAVAIVAVAFFVIIRTVFLS